MTDDDRDLLAWLDEGEVADLRAYIQQAQIRLARLADLTDLVGIVEPSERRFNTADHRRLTSSLVGVSSRLIMARKRRTRCMAMGADDAQD